ncbi:complement C1s subcomponent-like [Heterodontus francisci]|uniref:complement C1s subcomponent-like n=1 Tax=Heterodontus francisci TaxID=7792 RepID=UPI00355C5AFD
MWWTLCILLFPPASCLISLSGLQGQFSSPAYPQGYPNDVSQSWEIQVPGGYGIKLSFTHINMEPSPDCAYDNVQIFCDEALYPPICGSSSRDGKEFQFPQVYETSGNWMRVTFISDFSNEERYTGFTAYYTAVDIDECEEEDPCSHQCNNYIGGFHCSCRPGYFLQENQRICAVNCSGQVFRRFKGLITSPDYPEAYAENSECHYRIQIERGFELLLEFDGDFDVEGDPSTGCRSDVLKVTSGTKEYGPFCGTQAPIIQDLLSNVVEITFKTDGEGERKGWKITYRSTAKQCPLDILEHYVIRPRKAEYDYKDSVQLRCQAGFELYENQNNMPIDSATVYCQKDGTWNRSSYACQPVNCGPPTKLKNGNENFTETVYRFQNTYSCEEPYYKLEGNAVFKCSADADWVDVASGRNVLPTCKPVCGKCRLSTETGRIFGGKRAELGFFPWQVRLFTGSGEMGGGALVSDDWVLTAAHLFDRSAWAQVRGGLVDLRDTQAGGTFPMERAIVHPGYRRQAEGGGSRPNFDHDIALVKLQRGVRLGPNVSPVCLPEPGEASPPGKGTLGYIAGWGRTELRDLAIFLQYAQVPIVSMGKCERSDYKGKKPVFTANMICAGVAGTDSCQGDSGGPYVFTDPRDPSRHVVRGIVSFGPQQCGSYGVYTDVGRYLDWIETTMRQHESSDSGEEDA